MRCRLRSLLEPDAKLKTHTAKRAPFGRGSRIDNANGGGLLDGGHAKERSAKARLCHAHGECTVEVIVVDVRDQRLHFGSDSNETSPGVVPQFVVRRGEAVQPFVNGKRPVPHELVVQLAEHSER